MRSRPSSRLVILDAEDRIFLFCHHDTDRRYWIIPGGGVDDGETWEQAALRELREETGLDGLDLGPWLWYREKPGLIGGQLMLSRERYYLVRAPGAVIDTANQFDYERAVYLEHRWWSLADLRTTTETIYPVDLADLLAPVLAGIFPDPPAQIRE